MRHHHSNTLSWMFRFAVHLFRRTVCFFCCCSWAVSRRLLSTVCLILCECSISSWQNWSWLIPVVFLLLNQYDSWNQGRDVQWQSSCGLQLHWWNFQFSSTKHTFPEPLCRNSLSKKYQTWLSLLSHFKPLHTERAYGQKTLLLRHYCSHTCSMSTSICVWHVQ